MKPLRTRFWLLRETTAAATLSGFEVEDLGVAQTGKLSDCGECSKDVPKPQCHEVSLENAASPNSLILWGFSRVFVGSKSR
jgi:hypothetical protein